MTCRVCKHWKGDSYSWNEDGKPPVTGPCRRDPVPVDVASTYSCSSCVVDIGDAWHWLFNYRHDAKELRKERKQHDATTATLERVRARARSLKEQLSRARVQDGTKTT